MKACFRRSWTRCSCWTWWGPEIFWGKHRFRGGVEKEEDQRMTQSWNFLQGWKCSKGWCFCYNLSDDTLLSCWFHSVRIWSGEGNSQPNFWRCFQPHWNDQKRSHNFLKTSPSFWFLCWRSCPPANTSTVLAVMNEFGPYIGLCWSPHLIKIFCTHIHKWYLWLLPVSSASKGSRSLKRRWSCWSRSRWFHHSDEAVVTWM